MNSSDIHSKKEVDSQFENHETVAGKGSFVSGMNADFLREEHLRIAEEHLQQAVDAAKSAGISKDELVETLGMLYDGD